MKFEILRASDLMHEKQPCFSAFKEGPNWFVEINTLEDLLALRAEVKADLIFDPQKIWIYDDYME